jgi:putative DNA methylase
LLEVFEPRSDKEVGVGTVARGSATCPVTGFTTKVESVRAQLKKRRGGASDARMFCVVTTRVREKGRHYRIPTDADREAFVAAAVELERREREDGTERSKVGREAGLRSKNAGEGLNQNRSLVPDEPLDVRGIRHTWAMIYGLERWGDLFTPRQSLFLSTLARLIRKAGYLMATGHRSSTENPIASGSTESEIVKQADEKPSAGSSINKDEKHFAEAVMTCLAMVLGRQADYLSSLAVWSSGGEFVAHTFGRQAIPMVWEFPECQPLTDSSGNLDGALGWVIRVIEANITGDSTQGVVQQASATTHPLPNDSAMAFVTDPPYYDAVPYAYLSDFFYVWMRRTLGEVHPDLFKDEAVPKDAEIVVDRPHQLSPTTKDIEFYERELTKAFTEGRRILAPNGIGTIVFASKTTASWEAILKAVIDAGFIVTGSWPIDTEREARVAALGQARLGSSIHLVCRPREDENGVITEQIGEWRDVLGELPRRIHEWMPRLAAEGVVGADAIFACLGPALEIFSRYSQVEKANGENATLREYLEHVWATVSTEALSLIFKDANAAGLEPDARLTAMWLWTIGGAAKNGGEPASNDEEPDIDSDDDENSTSSGSKSKMSGGFFLEYDAARKIAQGLGVYLEQSESLVEVKGDKARLLPVSERTQYLFGKGVKGSESVGSSKKKVKQKMLFDQLDEVDAAESGWTDLKGPTAGNTGLDRVHQSMILFAANRGEMLKRFLVDDGVGKDARFWKLADNLNKLYPTGTDERRWIEGVLARKKGLGL